MRNPDGLLTGSDRSAHPAATARAQVDPAQASGRRQDPAGRRTHRVKVLAVIAGEAPNEGMFLTDLLQLAGFLFAGWLLFRFTDWIYRRGSGADPAAPDRGTVPDLDTALTGESATVGAIVADHGVHAPRSPAHLPGSGARRREDLRDARRSTPAGVTRH